MFAHIVSGNVRQGRPEMLARRCVGHLLLLLLKQRGDSAEAPSSAEIHAVQMRDLAVAAVADDCGAKESCRLAPRKAGQEMAEPCGKF